MKYDRVIINVSRGIIHEHHIGSYFFPLRMNGQICLQFIGNESDNLTYNVSLGIIQQMWFLHYGTAAHFRTIVRKFLNYGFPQRWIGQGGPISWPARSSHLNPMVFFVWERVLGLCDSSTWCWYFKRTYSICSWPNTKHSRNFQQNTQEHVTQAYCMHWGKWKPLR